MKNNKDLIDSMCKGCSMSIIALDEIINKTDCKIIEDIKIIKSDYNNFLKEAESILKKKDSEIKGINLFEKISSGIMIDLKLINIDDEKIADMVVKGINMGLNETEKILTSNNISSDYQQLAKDYINMQNKSKDSLSKYLR